MKYSTVYVGMDVHKETFSLCCFTNEKEKAEYPQKVDGRYSKVINYIEAMRFHYGDDALFMDYAITATQKKILGAFRDEREIGEEQSQ